MTSKSFWAESTWHSSSAHQGASITCSRCGSASWQETEALKQLQNLLPARQQQNCCQQSFPVKAICAATDKVGEKKNTIGREHNK